MELQPNNLQTKPSFFRSKKFFIILTVVLILGIAGGVGYYFCGRDRNKQTAEQSTNTNKSAENTETQTNQAATTNAASDIVTKLSAVSIDDISSALGEITTTISTFNSAGNGR